MGLFDFFFKKNKGTKPLNEALVTTEVEDGVFMPNAFAKHWDEIKKTAIDFIEIKATPSSAINYTESSFGAVPFIPKGFDYPVDKDGRPMVPLAQLNFAEFPPLAQYPTKGLLQFYIADDDCYGLDFKNQFNPQSFRVIYIESPEKMEMNNDISFVEQALQSENSPVDKPHRLSFTKKTDYVGLNDFRNSLHGFSIEEWLNEYEGDIKWKLENLGYTLFGTNGHKIGGYAYFTQSDPRDYDEQAKNNSLLLLQIDTDDAIMWGDCGVGNFFINPADLIKKDFSKVLYNWDCS